MAPECSGDFCGFHRKKADEMEVADEPIISIVQRHHLQQLYRFVL